VWWCRIQKIVFTRRRDTEREATARELEGRLSYLLQTTADYRSGSVVSSLQPLNDFWALYTQFYAILRVFLADSGSCL